MKSKILCLVISLVMIVCALASCNFGPGPDNGGNDYDGDEYEVTWNKTTVIFELTKNSNSDELSSGCERYYAGASTGNYETIDNSIKSRNSEAYKQANVDISYIYAGTDKTYGWGQNTDRINTGVDTVGKGKINDAVLTAEGDCGFGCFGSQRVKSRALAACQQHCDTFFFLEHKNHSFVIIVSRLCEV